MTKAEKDSQTEYAELKSKFTQLFTTIGLEQSEAQEQTRIYLQEIAISAVDTLHQGISQEEEDALQNQPFLDIIEKLAQEGFTEEQITKAIGESTVDLMVELFANLDLDQDQQVKVRKIFNPNKNE